MRRALGVKWTQRLQLKRVPGFGYLSEPDKWNDKQLLRRDKVNVMRVDYAEQGWDGLTKTVVRDF